ncbi:MAG: 2-amino-4-hydroxy-6-hydroxymethyldihydropteridine diphosphokinase [Candidatus Omnitrophica bacterium]|nr:2-amino-4-hydroxy-6-hydroxymethyldihydropteridine diphosphokinase [Candidatus Omnitrophota bacterium]MBU4488916.1 2-amino-4-hydroxy-6-hydroxymethyldihydropteridine diphosphokinase [Candidatus Omnitrophota bacterium]MCG2705312.1 2-amino-4-hydroxy-6-hydroxymethyldihydropteridine diphosphokinase [Candidatus Omnitrophota bacterium]
MKKFVNCYIGVGSNIGDRRKYVDSAILELKKNKSIRFKKASSIYETEPVSEMPQGKFLNGVLEIETSLTPLELLVALNNIEKTLGRVRTVKSGARTIDLDILYYSNKKIKKKDLIIPHPRISEREFVLKGLRELGKV